MLSRMNIQQATRQYEAWLAAHIRVIKSDLAAKHDDYLYGKPKSKKKRVARRR